MELPQWCEDSKGTVLGTRTQVCRVSALTYTTYVTRNGVDTVTGKADLLAIDYSYGNTGIGTIGHQIELSMYQGWGDALKASVNGQATMSGSCTRESASFPAQTLAPMNSWKTGESFFDTTATNPGDIGTCRTTWYLTFTNGTYEPAVAPYSLNEFRCDNATAGRASVGCVVPWYASAPPREASCRSPSRPSTGRCRRRGPRSNVALPV